MLVFLFYSVLDDIIQPYKKWGHKIKKNVDVFWWNNILTALIQKVIKYFKPLVFFIIFTRLCIEPCNFSVPATGEPPLCMSIAVVFALRRALESARADAGITKEYFDIRKILSNYIFIPCFISYILLFLRSIVLSFCFLILAFIDSFIIIQSLIFFHSYILGRQDS